MRDDLERVNRNIEKIKNWYKEPGITKSRKEALERSMTVQLQIKEMFENR